MKRLFEKYREIIMYLIFGVLTTLVGWVVYYGLLLGGRAVFGIPAEEDSSVRYIILYSSAQALQWVCAVLFAFFTNRRWVFTDADRSVPLVRQLGAFAGSRLVTFGMDYLITLGGTIALGALFPALKSAVLLGKERNAAELLSKLVAAVVVVVSNYIISKLLVFRKKKAADSAAENGK